MNRLAIIGFLFLLLLDVSCAKRAPGPNDSAVSNAFGLNVQDAKLDLTQGADLKPRLKTDSQGQVSLRSRDWLDASRRMFEAADNLGDTKLYEGRLQLIKMGHELSQGFYSFNNASTPMSPNLEPVAGNPFLEEAYFYVKDILNQQYQTTMTNASRHVDLAAKKVVVKKVPVFSDDKPIDVNQIVDVPISALEDFITNMRALDDETTKEVTDEISAQIQKEYLSVLNNIKTILAMKSPQETAFSYATRLKQAVNTITLIPDKYKDTINTGLDEVFYFAKKVDLCTTPETTLQTVIDLWEAVDNRAKYPADVKTAVTDAFHPFKDAEVIEMLNDNKDKLVKSDQWAQTAAKKPALMQSLLSNPAVVAYAKKLLVSDPDPARNGSDLFEALVDDWYNMDFRSALSSVSQIWDLSDSDMRLLRDVHNHLAPPEGTHPILAVKRKVILDTLKKFNTPFYYGSLYTPGLDWLKGYVNYEIIQEIQKRLGDAVNTFTAQIPGEINDAIHAQLKNLKLTSRTNVWDLFKKYSVQYLNQWIFGNKPSLPLIEKNQVLFRYQDRNLTPLVSPVETGAEIMGIGLSTAVARLNTLDFVNLKPDLPETRAIAFQSLCKLASLMGYTGIDQKPVASLMTSFTPSKKNQAFDVANYDADKATFAAADQIVLKNNFKLDPATLKAPKVSVAGQMELLMGLTKMIRYLKPWSPSSFDIGLQNLRIDEFPTQAIFSKPTFFLQALGLAATIIKNIPARMVVLTENGGVIPMSQVKDPSSIGVLGAALTDFDKDTISHVIRSHDMALTVIAINEFFDAISDLSRSSDKTVRDAAAEIEAQKPLIDELFLGMSFVSLRRLMAQDGGFYPSYNLDTQTPSSEPRVLQDQLLMEEALLVIGNFLDHSQGNLARLGAIDNFFFINNHFWNPRLGFYNQSESENGKNLYLADVAEAVKNTILIKPLLSNYADANPALRPSLQQLNDLQPYWLGRFFGERTAALPTVLKLGQFSP